MREELKIKCDNLITNYDILKSSMKWEQTRMVIQCASLYCAGDRKPNPERIDFYKDLLKEKAGVFSEIRGTIQPVLACSIDLNGGGEVFTDKILEVYDLLKKEFISAAQLVLAAQVIAERCERYGYPAIVKRAKELYKLMKKEHPLITGQNDYVLCALLAMSDQTNETLIIEIEKCYDYLKENFKWADGDALQSVSHILAQYNEPVELKCQRVLDLYAELKRRKHPFDKYYGFPMLALFNSVDKDTGELADELIEMSEYLKEHKGFGNFGLGESTRMVYAAVLLNQLYSDDKNLTASMINSTISAIVAQQVALTMCVIMASTT